MYRRRWSFLLLLISLEFLNLLYCLRYGFFLHRPSVVFSWFSLVIFCSFISTVRKKKLHVVNVWFRRLRSSQRCYLISLEIEKDAMICLFIRASSHVPGSTADAKGCGRNQFLLFTIIFHIKINAFGWNQFSDLELCLSIRCNKL